MKHLSLIMALQARYEDAWSEYNTVDVAQAKARGGDDEFRLERALHESSEESDLLVLAILYQVPDTDEELSVLAQHTANLSDRLSCNGKLRKRERDAFYHGINSIFDYLACEHRAGAASDGKQFIRDAKIANERRRLRTGLVDKAGEVAA